MDYFVHIFKGCQAEILKRGPHLEEAAEQPPHMILLDPYFVVYGKLISAAESLIKIRRLTV